MFPSDSATLPWERMNGPPADVGVCLSGGGLRSAAFSLGVLQVLQEQRQLLHGPTCAAYLAAVSGGSYTAGAFLLGARQQALKGLKSDVLPPLAEGSPEESHILTHGRYLLQHPLRTGCHLLGLAMLNFASLAMFFVLAGIMLAAYAACRWSVPSSFNLLLQLIDRLPSIVLVPALMIGVVALIRSYYLDYRVLSWRSFARRLLAGLLVFATCLPVLEAASGETWWSSQSMYKAVFFLLAILVIGAAINVVLRQKGVRGLVATVFNTLNFVVPRLLGFVLLAWSAVAWFRMLSPIYPENQVYHDVQALEKAIVLFVSGGFGAAFFSYVPNRASLHREYRRLLESCFSIERNEDTGTATQVAGALLSDLEPPQSGKTRFPRLLICATANVHVKIPGRGRQSFVPFVFSHDVCGVPGHAEAFFPTKKLELGREPAGLLTIKKEPLLSLFTAIAATGAAVSPSMGRYTVPSARALFVALNLRLGRWLPNPFSSRLRKAVLAKTVPGRFEWYSRLGPGFDEMVPEMLGFDGPRVYVSDGGHYDNLGLLTLLRARCAEIWCVDAEADRGGKAGELRRVLAIAREEVNITTDINADAFAVGPDRLYGATHTVGKIAYPGGFEGLLVVVKLGLTQESPAHLRQRRASDVRFPHHPTWDQVYNSDRMNAYRQLGRDSALRCLLSISNKET